MDPFSSYFNPVKQTKTFHQTEIVNNKIHENLLYPDFPCHSSSTNENKDKSKFIKPEYGMNFSVRKVVQQLRFYQQCAKKMILKSICLCF